MYGIYSPFHPVLQYVGHIQSLSSSIAICRAYTVPSIQYLTIFIANDQEIIQTAPKAQILKLLNRAGNICTFFVMLPSIYWFELKFTKCIFHAVKTDCLAYTARTRQHPLVN